MLNLIVLSVPQMISANIVSASVGAANFLPNYFISGTDTLNETTIALATAGYITNLLADHNYPNGCYHRYESNCTLTGYRTILQALGDYFDEAIVFSKGHRGMPYYPNTNHSSLLEYYGDDVVDATDIYSRTSSENVFTFIWHCETSEHYETGTIPYDYYGYYGMPYCWTHNYNLPCWGASGNQVFLGWVDQSPQYETEINATYNYAHVAYYFWYHMCNGDTVEQSLNKVAGLFGANNYLESPLCNKLVVWGDKTMELP